MAKVLIIDDSEVVIGMVQMMLEDAGYEVVALSSGLGASSRILEEQPDLVLMDVNMPAISGDSLVELIRKNPRLSTTKVVLFSDRPAKELGEIAGSCGADGFINKTSDQNELVGSVKSWIGA